MNLETPDEREGFQLGVEVGEAQSPPLHPGLSPSGQSCVGCPLLGLPWSLPPLCAVGELTRSDRPKAILGGSVETKPEPLFLGVSSIFPLLPPPSLTSPSLPLS